MAVFKRGKAAREREELSRKGQFINKTFKRHIRRCEVVGVVGPEDATEAASTVRELYHVFVKVKTPTGGELTVPLDYSIHEIKTLFGEAKDLIGKYCTIVYVGDSIKDAEKRGVARIERDMKARIAEERPNLSIGPLAGINPNIDHSKLGTESEYKGSSY